MRPMRLGARTDRGVDADAVSPLAMVAGSSATTPDIKGQHAPAACLAVSWSGQGWGGGAWPGQSAIVAWPTGVPAWAVMAGGTSNATAAIIQTRRRTRSMSAAAAVEHFQELVDLGLAVAFGAGMEGVRHAMLQVVAQRLLLDLVERR